MNIGVIGLGRMGEAIAYRLQMNGHTVIGYDAQEQTRVQLRAQGMIVVDDLHELATRVSVVWVMVPAGHITRSVIQTLCTVLAHHSLIIDGGNSFFNDSIENARYATAAGMRFLDCGTSGGVKGRAVGFCLMVGGERSAYDEIVPALHAIAAPGGYAYVGRSGAGHYVKMIHNGIEYALLQAYGEGFHLIKNGTFADEYIDLAQLTALWNNGSVIRSFILELSHDIFKKDQSLTTISGEVEHTGMGSWTVQEAEKHAIPVPVIERSLAIRTWSKTTGGNYATKVVSLLRNAFGGHAFKHTQGQ